MNQIEAEYKKQKNCEFINFLEGFKITLEKYSESSILKYLDEKNTSSDKILDSIKSIIFAAEKGITNFKNDNIKISQAELKL